jgi:hypothetical protein
MGLMSVVVGVGVGVDDDVVGQVMHQRVVHPYNMRSWQSSHLLVLHYGFHMSKQTVPRHACH